jgi:hypothetical protein
VPGLGTNGKFAVSVGWRTSKASRSYFDSRLNHNFTELWKPVEKLNILDVTARYQASRRFGITATLPVVLNHFSMLFPPQSPSLSKRDGWSASGVGDLSIYSQGLLLDPRYHPFQNISLGVGLKFPTGNWNLKANIPDETGGNIARRAMYPSVMQPGDGGLGIIVGADAFKTFRKPQILKNYTFFASGNYLINPRDTNGTQSMVSSLGVPLTANFANRLTNSVADSYSVAIGVNIRLPKTRDNPLFKGLRPRIVGRWEGVRSHDLFGKNDGFRQPGYAMSCGPGLTYSFGKNALLVDVPIIFNRHINPGDTILPGLPVKGGPGKLSANRQMGLVAPVSLSLRYIRAF